MFDLHMHSKYSEDGEFTPAELVRRCKASGIGTMSLTDHNTVSGVKEAAEEALVLGLEFVPGIEIDCCLGDRVFHMLGYGMDYTLQCFADIEAHVAEQYAAASQVMLEKVRRLGLDVDTARLDEITADCYWKKRYYGEAFGEALLTDQRFESSEILRPYRPGGEKGDNPLINIYWDFFSQDKPCYVPLSYPSMKEVIDTVHSAGGLAVLAHPECNMGLNSALAKEIYALGADGIEAFTSYHGEEATEYYCDFARKHGMYITSGSDYHGKIKPTIALGCASGSAAAIEEGERFAKALRALRR